MNSTNAIVKAQFRRSVVLWLLICAILVAAMVVVGGYTRLSGSGLSITEWKPIHGVFPPANEEEWQEEFTSYQAIPQFSAINSTMTLEEFKTIFWPEFLHRLLGRAIGLVFLLPFVFFFARKAFSTGFSLRLVGIFALGGLQGLVGWIMVQSGLTDATHVSHFKLAAHLSLAFFIFACIWWALLDVRALDHDTPAHPGRDASTGFKRIFMLLCIQLVYGALLAGLHGGLVFNTFPTMNGEWVPADIAALTPGWRNPLENITTVQFIHRWLAKLLFLSYVLWWYSERASIADPALRRLLAMIFFVLLTQIILGIGTLLTMVPLELALLHQLTGFVLFGLFVTVLHAVKG